MTPNDVAVTTRWCAGSLQRVLFEGTDWPVSRWAGLAPRARPTTFCPACERPVILKIGPVRRHHAAHHSGDECRVATHPETADHYNAKFRLADELRRVGRLLLRDGCAEVMPPLRGKKRPSTCPKSRTREWMSGWDTVVVERQLGSLRPDVQVLMEGQVLGVIEVLGTHPVPAVKVEALAALGVPWLEITTADVFGRTAALWVAEDPIAVTREAPQPGEWRCPAHEQGLVRVRGPHEEPPREWPEWFSRFVDFYSLQGDGRRQRCMYRVLQSQRPGAGVQMHLERAGHREPLWATESTAPLTRETLPREAFEQDIRAMELLLGAKHDLPMDWIAEEWSTFNPPPRLTWDASRGEWVPRLELRESAQVGD